ncbi:hypothetical protein EW026_g5773 [Hermanssonia centrifuga]|uniref:DNA-directed RNA polymerase n=1 Tax=Hermanssonia centrifuga TaxID=98765 RepID=A0A4S4KDA0_9APHY|nr:hypothetical protein EW026_g5773 [Hermanssonia centrifuga]
MASTKEPTKASYWVEDAVALYEAMESGSDQVAPTANTYAHMLLAWLRFNPETQSPISATVELHEPVRLLRCLIDRDISVALVVSDRAFKSNEEAAMAIKVLSKAAVEMNVSRIVSELGMAKVQGSYAPDPLEDIPEAIPVQRVKKPDVQAIHGPDGSVVDIDIEAQIEEPEYEVPFNLANLRKHLAQVTLARRVLSEDSAARQKLLEESVYDVAVERLKHQATLFENLGLQDKGLNNADLRAWMWAWHERLQVRIKAEVANLVQSETRAKSLNRLGPFLSLIKPEKLSLLTILEVMHLQGSGGVTAGMKTARALIAVGRAVEIEYKAEMCKKNNIAIPNNSGRTDHGFFSNLGYRDLFARRVAARKYMEDSEEWTSDWTQVVRVRVGSVLVDALMDVATVTRTALDKRTGETVSEQQPAFFHSYEYLRGHKLGVIKLNPVVSERIAKDQLRETLHPRHLPMLVKPKPWLSHDQGGYLYNKTSAMRYKDSQEQYSYLRQASSLGNLELVYASLDVLGNTPWQINRQIFDVVLEVWNSGKQLGKIPSAVYEEPEPEKPENFDRDPKAKTIYYARHRQYAVGKANNHSDRCNINYKIEIARTFLGDTIYLPHNVDFRGRAYPIPPHLNHIGDDLSRGLLKFGESRPLGERGLRWLKIHIANLYGYDKGTFEERIQFVHDHMEDIYDSVDKPLDGKCWWQKADDPWQCLAACMEIKAALESGDPHAYESALPVHQDGTCNGLQHYAALGGDARGAAQVNLSITEKPSDVYTYVADMVQESLKEDIAKGDRIAMKLDGRIARKVVKQTVMTTVYGVTFIGAREQIEKQLKDNGSIDIEDAWAASSYLARKVLSCIGDLFTGAKSIQNWLNTAARLISKSIPPERIPGAPGSDQIVVKRPAPPKKGKKSWSKEQMTSVIWTTPLGLPIVQPYRQVKRKQIKTQLQTVYISDPNSPATVNTMKQASAFPPNFIHSLDATHMMLTALECRSRDVTFASVHDSYWTHACSVDEMSAVIRDTFIALHSSDVLTKLDEELRERYKNHKIPIASLKGGGFLTKLGYTVKDRRVVRLNEQSAGSALIDTEEYDVEPQPKKGRRRPRSIEADEFDEEMEEEIEENEEEEGNDNDDELDKRFVNLVDILPPLPVKGQFDVSTIKGSLYFFS